MTKDDMLRERALTVLNQCSPAKIEALSLDEIKELVNEIRAYQIELEFQNEELRINRSEIEESNKKFHELYDSAPIGYFTFDKEGIVRRSNTFGNKLLKKEKTSPVSKSFQSYVHDDFKESFHAFLRRIFTSKSKEIEEIRIINKEGENLYVRLKGIRSQYDPNECLVTAADITESKRAQEILKSSLEEKERLEIAMAIQDEERGSISEVLHNGIAQSLYALQLLVENNYNSFDKEIGKKILQSIESSIDEIRSISFELMPHILEEFGLHESLQELCNKKTRAELLILYSHLGEKNRYSQKIEISIYRIIQEIVNNIIKHSKASIASINTDVYKNCFRIVVEDNGVCFDLSNVDKNCIGLRTIKNRIHVLNGKMDIESTAEYGKRLCIIIPIQ